MRTESTSRDQKARGGLAFSRGRSIEVSDEVHGSCMFVVLREWLIGERIYHEHHCFPVALIGLSHRREGGFLRQNERDRHPPDAVKISKIDIPGWAPHERWFVDADRRRSIGTSFNPVLCRIARRLWWLALNEVSR